MSKKNKTMADIGRKGGQNSRKNLSPKVRRQLAKKAAEARWAGENERKRIAALVARKRPLSNPFNEEAAWNSLLEAIARYTDLFADLWTSIYRGNENLDDWIERKRLGGSKIEAFVRDTLRQWRSEECETFPDPALMIARCVVRNVAESRGPISIEIILNQEYRSPYVQMVAIREAAIKELKQFFREASDVANLTLMAECAARVWWGGELPKNLATEIKLRRRIIDSEATPVGQTMVYRWIRSMESLLGWKPTSIPAPQWFDTL